MSQYEWYRVVLHGCQVCATISIPIVAVLLQEMFKRRARQRHTNKNK